MPMNVRTGPCVGHVNVRTGRASGHVTYQLLQLCEGTNMIGGADKQKNYHDIDEATFQAFLETHPNGATIQEIATVMGMTSCRVGQITNKSLVKLLRVCERRDLKASDFPTKETMWDRLEVG